MKSALGFICISFIGMYITIIVAFYYREQYRYNSFVQTIKESAEVATTNQLDKSSRGNMGENHVVKADFEQVFKELFMGSISTKVEIKDFKFEYLEEGDGYLKVVYISVTDDRDNVYQVVVATDLNN